MTQVAKLFQNGRSQAVRLPAAYRFNDCDEVYIRRDPDTGDVILSRRPDTWDGFLEARRRARVPETFLGANERQQTLNQRDPLKDWDE